MNIGMNGVLVLHHGFLIFLISVLLPSLYSFITLFTIFPLPKTEDTPIPREFSFSSFQIPNPFKEMTAGMKRAERAEECGFGRFGMNV